VENHRAIKILHGTSVFRRSDLTNDEILRLRGLVPFSPTMVFLVKAGELKQLADTCEVEIHDRGQKLAAKPLTYYLAQKTGFVRLQADYHHPGQAERGIRSLLESKAIFSKGSVFFIGVNDDLFEQLWNRVPPNGKGRPGHGARARPTWSIAESKSPASGAQGIEGKIRR